MGYLLLAFTLFPYIKIVETNSDIQPYALIVAIVTYAYFRIQFLPLPIALLFIPLAWSLVLVSLSGPSMDALRSVANYASLFFISASSYHFLKRSNGLSFLYVEAACYVWAIAGAIQLLGVEGLFEYILPVQTRGVDQAGESGRGVIGLAPEPTFYGIYCGFLMVITYFYASRCGWDRRKILVMIMLVSQIVFFAKSSMVIALMFLYALLYTLIRCVTLNVRIGKAVLASIVLFCIVLVGMDSLEGSRFYTLVAMTMEEPSAVLFSDASVHARVTHAVFAIKGLIDNWFLPHGYEQFWNYLYEMESEFHEWFWRVPEANRIMSGLGMALFELGFVGVAISMTVIFSLWRFYHEVRGEFVVMAVFLNIALFSAIQLAFPPLAFLIGLLNYYGQSSVRFRVPSECQRFDGLPDKACG